jgi:hypothetical protein
MKYARTLLPFSAAVFLAGLTAWSLPCSAQGNEPLLEDPGTKAHKLIQEGKYKECLEYIEPLAQGGEARTPVVQYYYARCLQRSGRTAEAAEHFQAVLRLHPFGWLDTYSKRALEELKYSDDVKAGRVQTNTRRGFKAGVGYIGCKLMASKVKFVYPQSPAAKANLTVDDTIIAVDGKDCRSLGHEEISALLTGGAVESGRQRTASSASTSADSGDGKYVPTGAKLLPSDPQITVFRHTNDTDEMKDILISAVLRLPRSLRSEVASAGIGLTLAPTVLEAFPDMAMETPRGYIHGGGYSNCGGLFSPKHSAIYVGERVSMLSSVPHLNSRLEHTLFHEFGHAIDHCRHISHGASFTSAYEQDCGRLTNGVRTQFHYFTQEGQAGPSELFAELFSVNIQKPNERNTNDINLSRTFPNCYKVVQGDFSDVTN